MTTLILLGIAIATLSSAFESFAKKVMKKRIRSVVFTVITFVLIIASLIFVCKKLLFIALAIAIVHLVITKLDFRKTILKK